MSRVGAGEKRKWLRVDSKHTHTHTQTNEHTATGAPCFLHPYPSIHNHCNLWRRLTKGILCNVIFSRIITRYKMCDAQKLLSYKCWTSFSYSNAIIRLCYFGISIWFYFNIHVYLSTFIPMMKSLRKTTVSLFYHEYTFHA